MTSIYLSQDLQRYDDWKKRAAQGLAALRQWLLDHDLLTRPVDQRLEQAQQTIREDKLTVAVVAEVSRGKTELINAMFFAEQGRRLLPSTAGRTTMCPTELFWDEREQQAYIALLPIETRLQQTSLTALKQQPDQWIREPLDTSSPERVANGLLRVIESKTVSRDEAEKLGMFTPDVHQLASEDKDHIEVPRWRHALISFPHPILRQGLILLDTPGLNALGNEPELTLGMLPNAHAVLFILAADAGVTKTDMELWRNYVVRNRHSKGLLVALNKIDSLWDELKSASDVRAIIEQQHQETARTLAIPPQQVYPISAQKGLLGKIRHDGELIHQSGLSALEQALSKDLLHGRRQLIRETIMDEAGQVLETARELITSRMNDTRQQMSELNQLTEQGDHVMKELLVKSRNEQTRYLKVIEDFKTRRGQYLGQARQLQEAVDLEQVRASIENARKQMENSWTTLGLRRVMSELFEDFRGRMQRITLESERTRRLIQDIYRQFAEEHGFDKVHPKLYSVMKQRVELEKILKEGEDFRQGSLVTVMSRRYIIQRFFIVMADRVEQLFRSLQGAVDNWLISALEPLHLHIKDRKSTIEANLASLQKLRGPQSSVQGRIEELQQHYTRMARDMTRIRSIQNDIIGD